MQKSLRSANDFGERLFVLIQLHDVMSESIDVLLSVCLNFWRTFQGLKLDRISCELCVPKQRSCLCGVSLCFSGGQTGVGGAMEHKAGDAEPLCLCGQRRLPVPSAAHSPAASGPWQESVSVLVQRSMPWHCWYGGRKGAAGSNLCCLQSKLACSVLPECFWGWCCRLV